MSLFQKITRNRLPGFLRILIETPQEFNELDEAIEEIKEAEGTRVAVELFGEPFAEDLYPLHYKKVFRELKSAADSVGKEIDFTILTMLNFERPIQLEVIDLMKWLSREEIDHRLVAMYSVSSHRNNNFKNNIDVLGDFVSKIDIVMNKNTIQFLLADHQDEYLDELYERYPFSIAHYYSTPGAFNRKERVKFFPRREQDIYDAYLKALDRFPKADCFNIWKRTALDATYVAEIGCQGEQVCLKKDNVQYCNYNGNCDNGKTCDIFIHKHNCLGCKYFNRCEVDCYFSEIDKAVERMDDCMLKKIYEELRRRYE